jgi:hypothetical protein
VVGFAVGINAGARVDELGTLGAARGEELVVAGFVQHKILVRDAGRRKRLAAQGASETTGVPVMVREIDMSAARRFPAARAHFRGTGWNVPECVIAGELAWDNGDAVGEGERRILHRMAIERLEVFLKS